MRAIRRQSREESVDIEKILKEKPIKQKSLQKKGGDKLVEISTSPTQSDLLSLQKQYERKIKALELQVAQSLSVSGTLSKNEEKLLNAIRSEKMLQKVEEPIIGRSRLIKEYKINTKYLDTAISGLEIKGIILRTAVKYSAKIMTNSWKIL